MRSLADLIQFDLDNPELELPPGFSDQSEYANSPPFHPDQSLTPSSISLLAAEGTNGFTAAYFESLASNHDLGRTRGIDAALRNNNLDALVMPASVASGPAGKSQRPAFLF